MKLVNDTKAAAQPAPEPVTVAHGTNGAINFTVPADVPFSRAFDDLSVLISSALDAVESVAVNEVPGTDATPTWSAVHTLQLAYALVQGMHGGYTQHRKQARG